MLLFITAKINSRGKFFMKRIAKTLMLTLSALLVLNFAGCKTEVTPDGSETENGGAVITGTDLETAKVQLTNRLRHFLRMQK